MKTVIQFEHVSKQYRLGVTRTSLLNTLSKTLRKVLRPDSQKSQVKDVLWALRDVSFELSRGESLAFVGRNGAGKSTMLKLLASITRPTAGRIETSGRLSALIELGAGFHGDLTGRENIYLNGTILGLSRSQIRRRFDEIVAFSELERFIETPVKRYSSGMLVRLGFAVASCIDPEILLVDEVLAVGDASFRQKCLQRIQSLLDQGTSIIFVSHNLYMVQAVCPKALYIEDGRVKHQGPTPEVIDMYERDLHEDRAKEFARAHSNRTEHITDVEITEVEILDENGLGQSEFSSEQTAEFRVHYNARLSAGSVNAVVHIKRTDGLICSMMRTSLDQVNLSLKPEKGTFSVIIQPLQLTGGMYYVDVQITNAKDSILLATQSSKWFYVSGLALSHEEGNGVFEPNRKWVNHQNPLLRYGVDVRDGRLL